MNRQTKKQIRNFQTSLRTKKVKLKKQDEVGSDRVKKRGGDNRDNCFRKGGQRGCVGRAEIFFCFQFHPS